MAHAGDVLAVAGLSRPYVFVDEWDVAALLRPLLRWNHNWAIARAMDGLEPYVRQA